MKVQANSKAIELSTKDVFGNPISLKQFGGKRILLSFLRFTGCPVCNLHVYELLKRKEDIESNNLIIIIVFESEVDTLKKYIKNEELPFVFISDPNQKLYNSYSVEKSWCKLVKWGLTIRGLSNGIKGYLKYNKFSSMQGSSNRVEAEFLIDENGFVKIAHYGNIVGDYMPISSYLP